MPFTITEDTVNGPRYLYCCILSLEGLGWMVVVGGSDMLLPATNLTWTLRLFTLGGCCPTYLSFLHTMSSLSWERP